MAGGALGGGAGYGLLRQPSLQLEESKEKMKKIEEALQKYNEQHAEAMRQFGRIGNAQERIGKGIEAAKALGANPGQPK